MKENIGQVGRRGLLTALVLFMAFAASAATYYVDAKQGDDAKYDGTSATPSETPSASEGLFVGPKQSLEAANALVVKKGDVLKIAPGEYLLDETITNNTANITFQGTDPNHNPSNVVINGQGKVKGLHFGCTDYATALTVRDLTVSNCYNSLDKYGGGVFISGSIKPTVSNCVFVANTNSVAGGCGGGVLDGPNMLSIYRNCHFHANYAESGGGIINGGDTLANLQMYDCVLSDNGAKNGGGEYSDRNRDAKFYGCQFLRNTATSCGGALYKQVSIASNCTFTANVAGEGGAHYGGDGFSTMYFDDCRFYENRATYGGALRPTTNGHTVRRCVFERNTASTHGGAIYALGSINSLRLVDACTFRGNRASRGGAVMCIIGEFRSCLFEDNVATSCGAAWDIATNNSWSEIVRRGYRDVYPWVITNCVFRRNGIPNRSNGGTICLWNFGQQMRFADCEFTENYNTNTLASKDQTGSSEGGVIWSPQLGSLERCTFSNNWALGVHGVAFAGTVTNGIRNCIFFGNHAVASTGSDQRDGAGGALFLLHGGNHGSAGLTNANGTACMTLIENCEFTSNAVSGKAGSAIACCYRGLDLRNCTFTGNVVTNSGKVWGATMGTVAMSVNLTKTTTNLGSIYNTLPLWVDSCSFVGNRSTGRGAAICAWENGLENKNILRCEGYIRNSLFADNQVVAHGTDVSNAGEGAAICVRTQHVAIANCTFTGGRAVKGGAILATGADNNTTVTNCVFYDNTDTQSSSTTFDTANLAASKFGYCCAKAGGAIAEGNGNIISDAPLMADDHCAYVVRRDCGRDAGVLLDWMTADKLDLGGKPRVSGDAVDFGCYELWRRPGMFFFVQ